MTARDRVASTRRTLGAAAAARALLCAAALAASLLAVAGIADWLVGAPHALRVFLAPTATVLAIAVAAYALWRSRRVRSLPAVALWLEERVPTLSYSLVSALESSATSAPLEREVATVTWLPVVNRALGHALLPPLIVLAVAIATLLVLPAGVRTRIAQPRAGDTLLRPSLAPPALRNRLSPLVADVVPPAYTGKPRVTIEEPSSIEALTGAQAILRGRGTSTGIIATINGATIPVADSGAEWRVNVAMPARPAALELRDRTFARTVILVPHADSLPVVTLIAPARDTVMRAPTGALALSAQATDDFGLDAGWFEYIISSGEGENFTFRSGVVHRVTINDERVAHLTGALQLDALGLHPGDLVHIRAVARDRNDITGPGVGVSETRTIRVPRKNEYDSVAVEAAPPPDADKAQLSERMLIMLAEKLQQRRPSMQRPDVVKESQSIGTDQARLRQHVGEIIFARLGGAPETEDTGAGNTGTAHMTPDQMLAAADSATRSAGAGATDFEGDETPVVAVNRPLLEAYNAMWDASRSLGVGEPGTALPPMRAALAAIQRAREAERLYLRGKSPVVILDIAKVRLAGKRDDASSSTLPPRASLDSSAERRAIRFDNALDRLASDPSAAIDSLLALRVDALTSAPELAAALAPAIDSLRSGRDATAPLVRARRVAAGVTVQRADSPWGGAW